MLTTVEDSAWRLIRKHRRRAVFVAMERLNKGIDRGDRSARDFWAQVVHAIHDYERTGELPARKTSGRWPTEARSQVRRSATASDVHRRAMDETSPMREFDAIADAFMRSAGQSQNGLGQPSP